LEVFGVRRPLVVHANVHDVALHVIERFVIERRVDCSGSSLKVDNPHAALPARDVHSIHRGTKDIAVRPSVRIR
jgi:hypothetical protein